MILLKEGSISLRSWWPSVEATYIRMYENSYFFLLLVRCQDTSLRLVGGPSASEGRVEVCINETWGTICDNSWSTNDANIVCGQLGYLSRGSISVLHNTLDSNLFFIDSSIIFVYLQVLLHIPMQGLDLALDPSISTTWSAMVWNQASSIASAMVLEL